MSIEDYIGKRCWQCRAYKIFMSGTIIDVKSEKGWTLALVDWDKSSQPTWERVMNLGFKLPKEALSLIQD